MNVQKLLSILTALGFLATAAYGHGKRDKALDFTRGIPLG
jgi:hypothetical protein